MIIDIHKKFLLKLQAQKSDQQTFAIKNAYKLLKFTINTSGVELIWCDFLWHEVFHKSKIGNLATLILTTFAWKSCIKVTKMIFDKRARDSQWKMFPKMAWYIQSKQYKNVKHEWQKVGNIDDINN